MIGEPRNRKLTFIDLFAGCGGLSEGFLQSEQFNSLAHVEWELPMVQTLRARLVSRWNYSKDAALKSVIHFDLPDDVVVKRVTGRRIHPGSGRSYHTMFKPPKVANVDDVTGEPLVQRKDDNEETIVTRLQSYHTKTSPLIDFYKKQGILATVNADQSISEVYKQVTSVLPGKV